MPRRTRSPGEPQVTGGEARADVDPRALVERLQRENNALRRALRVLHDVANLLVAAEDVNATAHAILTALTAGVGLGFNRAMLFVPEAGGGGVLRGLAAVGPASREEADRVWRNIERDAPDLATLYEVGLARGGGGGSLDARVRQVLLDPAGVHARTPVGCVLRRDGTDPDHDAEGLFDLATCVVAPVPMAAGARGVLVVDNRFTGQAPDGVERLVVNLVAEHAGRALVAAESRAALAREARTDVLTGLDTRRVGMALLEHLVAAAQAGGPAAALVLVDLDGFKQVNDTLGHPVGDRVLATVAARIRDVLRRGERAFRYGGEEVGIVLTGATPAEARLAAERVREHVAAAPVPLPGGGALSVTCSVGVATSEKHGRDGAALLRAADDALLRAKRNGRNRVETA